MQKSSNSIYCCFYYRDRNRLIINASRVAERKSVGRRISEAFGIKGSKLKEADDCTEGDVEGHVKFDKFPEIID